MGQGRGFTYIPGLSGVSAQAEAGLVTAGDVNQPLLRALAGGGRAGSYNVAPGVQGQVGHGLLDDLGRAGIDGRLHGGNGRRDIVLSLAEPALELLGKRHLLFGERKRRKHNEESLGEAHCGGEQGVVLRGVDEGCEVEARDGARRCATMR